MSDQSRNTYRGDTSRSPRDLSGERSAGMNQVQDRSGYRSGGAAPGSRFYTYRMDEDRESGRQGRTPHGNYPQDLDELYSRPEQIKRIEDGRASTAYVPKKKNIFRKLLMWIFQIVLVIMFAYVLVYFFGQTRTNVGQSMDTTLSGGDEVLINILAYQMKSPDRGDVIAFKPGGSSSGRTSIKRVIGLPGETIQIIDGQIYIDGKVYLEQANYPAITNPGMASEPITLKSKEYFVLGDNRNNSEDSRFAEIGNVTTDMIEGRVWYVLNPSSHRGRLN